MADMVLIVSYFALLLGFGVIVANLMKKIRIPDAFLLLLVGLICGPTIWKHPTVVKYVNFTIVDVEAMSVVPDFLRTLALVLIVFIGAFNLKFGELKRFSDVSLKLAFIIVFFNTLFLGFAAKIIFDLQIIPALLIGAIISGTDYSVVYAFEDSLKKYANVLTVLKVESILNSPLSVLIPILLLDLVKLVPGEAILPNIYILQFWQMIAGGVGSGVIFGLAVSKILHKMLREYTPLIIFSIALLSYALAELVGGSGMLSVAVAGFIIGNLAFPHKEAVREFHTEFSDMLRISVFTLLGAQVFLDLHPLLLIAEFLFALVVLFSRPIITSFLLGEFGETLDREGEVLINYIAPRGISAAAMAPIASTVLGNELIINVVFTVIFFTVLFSTVVAQLVSTGKLAEKIEEPVTEQEEAGE
jgi:cell volume regulation protein A